MRDAIGCGPFRTLWVSGACRSRGRTVRRCGPHNAGVVSHEQSPTVEAASMRSDIVSDSYAAGSLSGHSGAAEGSLHCRRPGGPRSGTLRRVEVVG